MTNIDGSHCFETVLESGTTQSRWSIYKKQLKRDDITWSRIKSEKENQRCRSPGKCQELSESPVTIHSAAEFSEDEFSDNLPDLEDSVSIADQNGETECSAVCNITPKIGLLDSKHLERPFPSHFSTFTHKFTDSYIINGPVTEINEQKKQSSPIIINTKTYAPHKCSPSKCLQVTTLEIYSDIDNLESPVKPEEMYSDSIDIKPLCAVLTNSEEKSTGSLPLLSTNCWNPKNEDLVRVGDAQTRKDWMNLPQIDWRSCMTPIKKAKFSRIIQNEMQKNSSSPLCSLAESNSLQDALSLNTSATPSERHFLDSLLHETESDEETSPKSSPIVIPKPNQPVSQSKSSQSHNNCHTKQIEGEKLSEMSEKNHVLDYNWKLSESNKGKQTFGISDVENKVRKRQYSDNRINVCLLEKKNQHGHLSHTENHHKSCNCEKKQSSGLHSENSTSFEKNRTSSERKLLLYSKRHIFSSKNKHSSGSERRHSSCSERKHSSSSESKQLSGSENKHSSGSENKHSSSSENEHSSGFEKKHSSGSENKQLSGSENKHSSGSENKHSSGSENKQLSGSERKHSSGSENKHSSSSANKHSSGSENKHSSGSENKQLSGYERKHSSGSENKHSSSSENKHSSSSENKHSSSSENKQLSGSESKHSSGSDNKHSSCSENKHSSGSENKQLSGSENKQLSRSENKHSSSSENKHSSGSENKQLSRFENKHSSSSENKHSSSSENKHSSSSENKQLSGSENKQLSGSENEQLSGSENKQLSGSENKHSSGSENKHSSSSENKHSSGSENKQLPGSENKHSSGSENKQLSGSENKQLSGSKRKHSSGSERKHSSGSERKHSSGSERKHSSGSENKQLSGSENKHSSSSENKHSSGSENKQLSGFQKKHSSSSERKHSSGSENKQLSGSERKHSSGSENKHLSSSEMKHSSSSERKHSSGSENKQLSGSENKHSSGSKNKHSSSLENKHSSGSENKQLSGSQKKHSSSSERKYSSGSERKHSSGSENKQLSGSERKHSSGSENKHLSSSDMQHSSCSETKHSSGSENKQLSGSENKHSSGSENKHSSSSKNKHSSGSENKQLSGSQKKLSSSSERKYSSGSERKNSSGSEHKQLSGSENKQLSGSENKQLSGSERKHSFSSEKGKHHSSSKNLVGHQKHDSETEKIMSLSKVELKEKEKSSSPDSRNHTSKSSTYMKKHELAMYSNVQNHKFSDNRRHSLLSESKKRKYSTSDSESKSKHPCKRIMESTEGKTNPPEEKDGAYLQRDGDSKVKNPSSDTVTYKFKRELENQKTHSRKYCSVFVKNDIRSFFISTRKNKMCTENHIGDICSHDFPQYPVDVGRQVYDFTNYQINTIDGCFEEGLDFLDHAINFINDFSGKCRPSSAILDRLVEFGLRQTDKLHLVFKTFHTLLFINKKHPGSIAVVWNLISETMGSIDSGRNITSHSVLTLVRASLCLQLAIICLKDDLFSRDISDPKLIRQSMAYKILSYDSSSPNLKQIVTWLSLTLTSGEFEEVRESYLRLHLEENSADETENDCRNIEVNLIGTELRKILPMLQKLLDLGIQVSSSNMDASKFIASEVLRIYIYLPNLCHKKLLLHTMCSELLKFRLTQLILENHCDQALPCCDTFPESLKSIKRCYYECLPPRNLLTPPTTPQSLDGDSGDDSHIQVWFSPVSCEELVMLLYFLTQSYIRCSKKKSCAALRRRAFFSTQDMFTLSHMKEELDKLQEYTEELRHHILDITSELTSATNLYLKLMKCLTCQK